MPTSEGNVLDEFILVLCVCARTLDKGHGKRSRLT